LRQYLARRGARDIDEALKIRLDRQSRQMDRLERDGQVLLESWRCSSATRSPSPRAARARQGGARVGQERFQKFIDQVGGR